MKFIIFCVTILSVFIITKEEDVMDIADAAIELISNYMNKIKTSNPVYYEQEKAFIDSVLSQIEIYKAMTNSNFKYLQIQLILATIYGKISSQMDEKDKEEISKLFDFLKESIMKYTENIEKNETIKNETARNETTTNETLTEEQKKEIVSLINTSSIDRIFLLSLFLEVLILAGVGVCIVKRKRIKGRDIELWGRERLIHSDFP